MEIHVGIRLASGKGSSRSAPVVGTMKSFRVKPFLFMWRFSRIHGWYVIA